MQIEHKFIDICCTEHFVYMLSITNMVIQNFEAKSSHFNMEVYWNTWTVVGLNQNLFPEVLPCPYYIQVTLLVTFIWKGFFFNFIAWFVKNTCIIWTVTKRGKLWSKQNFVENKMDYAACLKNAVNFYVTWIYKRILEMFFMCICVCGQCFFLSGVKGVHLMGQHCPVRPLKDKHFWLSKFCVTLCNKVK
jgi:hypothetical protein